MRRQDGTWEQDIQCIVPPRQGKGAIFISNIEAASNPRTLQKHQIGAVITAVKGKNMAETMPKHIEYLYIPAIDHQTFDLSPFFQPSNQMLAEETQRTNVLVHCMAGVSRSATLVIAYLMKSRNLSFNEAFAIVKSKRKLINPNQSFVQQLQQFEKDIRGNTRREVSQNPKKEVQMNQSTSSSWFQKTKTSPSLLPTCSEQQYNKKLKNQIHQLFLARQKT